MVVAAAANGQSEEPSWSCEPPPWAGWPPGWAIPAMFMPDMSMADMSWFMAWEAVAGVGANPLQRINPPGPGMNPAGISAREKNAASSNAASSGFRAHLIAIRFFTQCSLTEWQRALHGR